MCDSASLLVGEILELPISPNPEQPDFRKPQPMGGVVSFFPGQQKCGFLGSVCLGWSVWDQEQASCLHSVSRALQVFCSFSRPRTH